MRGAYSDVGNLGVGDPLMEGELTPCDARTSAYYPGIIASCSKTDCTQIRGKDGIHIRLRCICCSAKPSATVFVVEMYHSFR